jgi:hypothetical protein
MSTIDALQKRITSAKSLQQKATELILSPSYMSDVQLDVSNRRCKDLTRRKGKAEVVRGKIEQLRKSADYLSDEKLLKVTSSLDSLRVSVEEGSKIQAELLAIQKDDAYLSAPDLKAFEEELASLQTIIEASPRGAGEHLKVAEEKEKAMASELECSVCLEVPQKAFFSGMKFHSNDTKKLISPNITTTCMGLCNKKMFVHFFITNHLRPISTLYEKT